MRSAALSLVFAVGVAAHAPTEPRWTTLPPTPTLPKATESGRVPVDGAKIWWAEFGRGDAVILLHGGLGSSRYWGGQVPALASRYRVVVIDTRGHGRSTRDTQPFSYEVMASDVVAVMKQLKIDRAAIVGWSDGAIVGLELAIHHPERVTRLFAFGANTDPSGLREEGVRSPTFREYLARTEKEYAELSSTPSAFKAFADDLGKMWATQPRITKEQLNGIRVPTWIVDGDHEELIDRDHTESIAAAIPRAGLLIQPEVSHFAPLQDPDLFTADVLHFLAHAGGDR